MDQRLKDLLDRARSAKMTEADLEEHRIALATANGYLSDSRVTVEAVRSTRQVMVAAGAKETAKE